MNLVTGGNLADLPAGLSKKFDGQPRPLLIKFNSWVGTMAVGASHYYLNFEEERNPFVGCPCEGREPHEHMPWDGGDRGDSWRLSFGTRREAVDAAHTLIKMMEGSPKYTLVIDEEELEEEEALGWQEYEREQERKQSYEYDREGD